MEKLLIDFRRYFDKTGLSAYLKMILNAITNDNKNYFILVNDCDVEKMRKELNCDNITIISAKTKPFSLQSNIEIPFIIIKHKITHFHAIHFDIPLFIFLTKCKLISTIHDIIPLKYSKFYKTNFVKKIYFNLMYRVCGFLSNNILTVSNYTKQDLVEYLKIPSEKIVVIYNSFRPPTINNILQSKNTDSYRILFVGSNFEHKNILSVVEAVKILKGKNINIHFDIAGAKKNYTNVIKDYIKINALEPNVKIWGKVSDKQLNELYNNANCYFFPSVV